MQEQTKSQQPSLAKRFVVKPSQNRLREYRERAKLSLREVAKVLELSVATISRHETADRGLTQSDIHEYSQLYKCESYELFFKPVREELDDESAKLVQDSQ